MKLRGVRFGRFHTADDWGLTMNVKEVTPPVPKTNFISIPGRDGDLDLTESISDTVNYENRLARYVFLLMDGTQAEREALIVEIIGVLHGKRMDIVDTDDYPDYYMTGRVAVTGTSNNAAYGTLTVEATCLPWRFASSLRTTIAEARSSRGVSVIMSNNGFRTVTPTLTVTGSATITFGEETKVLTEGTYKVPGLRLAPGVNTVSISGSGTVTFAYQEAIF